MNNRLIKQIGYLTCIFDIISIIIIHISFYGNILDPFRSILLLVCVPLVLLILPGVFLIDKAFVLPSLNTIISAISIILIYWNFCIISFDDGKAWFLNIVGMVTCILNIITVVISFIADNNFQYKKRSSYFIVIAVTLFGLIIIAIILFLYNIFNGTIHFI